MTNIDHPAFYPDLPETVPLSADAYMSLKPAEKAFVDAYLSTMGESAKAAGVALVDQIKRAAAHGQQLPVSGRAQAMLANPRVQAAIHERAKQICARFDIDANTVIKEVANIAMSNMANYLHVTPDGDPFIDLSKCTYGQLAAIQEITVEDFKEGRGDDSRDVRRVKLKLHSKLDALEKLMKYLQMYAPERVDVNVTVQAQHITANMSAEQLADLYAARLKQVNG